MTRPQRPPAPDATGTALASDEADRIGRHASWAELWSLVTQPKIMTTDPGLDAVRACL